MMADYTAEYGPKLSVHFPRENNGKMATDFPNRMLERNGLLSTFHHWLFQKNYGACDWLKQIARGAFLIIPILKCRKCFCLGGEKA